MSQQPIVSDSIVRRLAREGVADCFGVAGDFALKLCDAAARALAEAPGWICNDLAAS